MAAFSTVEAADLRAKELMASGVAIVAHGERRADGQIAVRLLRFVSTATMSTINNDGQSTAGAWDYLVDDAAS